MNKESRFRALFSENYRQLARYGRHRGLNAEEADDLIASTFEVVWRRFESIPDGDGAVLWLYGIAYNHSEIFAGRKDVRLDWPHGFLHHRCPNLQNSVTFRWRQSEQLWDRSPSMTVR